MTDKLPTFPMFYKQPLALDRRVYGGAGVLTRTDYAFTAKTNSVPLMIGEFAEASRHYPIVFTNGAEILPIALLGLRGEENLFLEPSTEPDGTRQWRKGGYIPAYIRRYPFILMETENVEQYTLCVDAPALAPPAEGIAEPLFTEAGELSVVGQRAADFCGQYQEEIARTRRFGQALAEHSVLRDHHATIELADGTKFSLSGFQVVDGAAFDQLPDGVFLEWRRHGWLPAVHLHAAAAANWRSLIDSTYQTLQAANNPCDRMSASKLGLAQENL